VYLDLQGFTRWVQESDPEEVAERTEQFFAIVQDRIQAYHGTLYQKLGDAALCVFGYPRILENSAERAVSAVLDIQEELHRRLQLTVHAGIATGRVLVVEGHPPRFVGEPMNLAARLEDLAEGHEILVHEPVRELTEHLFVYTLRGPHHFKGFEQPVRVYRLAGRRRERRPWRGLPSLPTPFIGREEELENLRLAYERFQRTHRPLMVRILGEPGIGKSRLFSEFFRQIHEPTTSLMGRALPYGRALFAPLAYMIHRDLRIITGEGPITRERLETYLNRRAPELSRHTLRPALELLEMLFSLRPFPSGFRPEEMQQFFLSFFEEHARMQGPFLLVLEDLQWADSGTFHVLEHLADRGLPILLITMARPPLPGEHVWQRYLERLEQRFPSILLHLRPLEPVHYERWLREVLNTEHPELARLLWRRTGGNPLLLEELIKTLIHHGRIRWVDHHWEITDAEDLEGALPQRIEETVLARVDGVPKETRDLLKTAALMGRIFWDGPLMAIHGMSRTSLDHALRWALDDGMVRSRALSQFPGHREYMFRHELLREAVLSTLTRKDKTHLSRKLLAYFETAPTPPLPMFAMLKLRLAETTGEGERIVRYARSVLSSMEHLGAYREITGILGPILQQPTVLALPMEELLPLVESLIRAYIHLGQYDDAQREIERFLQQTSSPEQRDRLHLLHAETLERQSRYPEALTLLSSIPAQGVEPSLSRRRLLLQIWILHHLGQEEEMETLWQRVEQLTSGENPEETMHRLNLRANTLPEHAIKQRLALYEQAIHLARRHQHVTMEQVLTNNLTQWSARGYMDRAYRELQRSLEIAEKTGDRLGEAIASYNMATWFADLGVWKEVDSWLDRYMERSEEIHNRLARVYGNFLRAYVAWRTGDPQKADESFRKALLAGWELQSLRLRAGMAFLYAHFLMEQGRVAAARRLVLWNRRYAHALEWALFTWRWGFTWTGAATTLQEVQATVPPHLEWTEWIWLFHVFMERCDRDDRRKDFRARGRRILQHVERHTPPPYQEALREHPLYAPFFQV
jgi:class 3 adenylate cyclase/tetratricopeptide (TPR) repeat protein